MTHEVVPLVNLPPALRERTPARIAVGSAGESYRTRTLLELRADHAAARDAVHDELSDELLRRLQLHIVNTLAVTKQQYLLRPDLGRRLDDAGRQMLESTFPKGCELQVVVGDGLSARAVAVQLPELFPRLLAGAAERGWSTGVPFAVRHCRVGVMNDVGELLDPRVVVLLIGERPGLSTAESLSAYMAYRPRSGHTDARRNLISNIHARGIGHDEATRRVLTLADQMMSLQSSGVGVNETLFGSAPVISSA
jgi:ethanolamine ammonia-lyase small subunit